MNVPQEALPTVLEKRWIVAQSFCLLFERDGMADLWLHENGHQLKEHDFRLYNTTLQAKQGCLRLLFLHILRFAICLL